MSTFLGTSLYTAGLAFVMSTFTLGWLMDDRPPGESFSLASTNDGINNIDLEFKNNAVHLNVHIDRPMTCDQVSTSLNLKSINVEDKVLIPECSKITTDLVIIVYREYITT